MNQLLASAMGSYPVPPDCDWDLYLGPVAEDVPYHPIYHPFNWRGWIDFGVGALGDMGAHLIDHPFWALGLTYPTSIEATSTQWGTMPIPARSERAGGIAGGARLQQAGLVSGRDDGALSVRRRADRSRRSSSIGTTAASIRRGPTCCRTTSRSRAKAA